MEFAANFTSVTIDAGRWARGREAEGWPILSVSDHFWTEQRAFPHLWVTLAEMACATSSARLMSAFANNLLRSPVEFAQASLALQRMCGGRFLAGLGAGWGRAEIAGSGLDYPPAAERAGRYIEAVQVAARLLREGACTFAGKHYRFEVPGLGPRPEVPPPLVVSVGGARTIPGAVPFADRVELNAISPSTRGGALDPATFAGIPRGHLVDLIARVRRVREDVPIGLFVLCGAGDDERVRGFERFLGQHAAEDSLCSGWFGAPEKVAESILSLAPLGIEWVQVSPFTDATFDLLAPLLLDRTIAAT